MTTCLVCGEDIPDDEPRLTAVVGSGKGRIEGVRHAECELTEERVAELIAAQDDGEAEGS